MKTKSLFLFILLFMRLTFYTQPEWRLGGNPAAGPNGTAVFSNIFGTMAGNNTAMRFQTTGADRMFMHANITNVINFQPAIARDGFIGIGNPLNFMPPSFLGVGPFSVLHINGLNPGVTPQQAGYRNWMHYGIVSTHNKDFMFMGQRANGAPDVTDAVFGWADNSAQDNMVFTFLTEGPGPGDLTGSGANGREIVRYTSGGNVGIGPRFNNPFAPQNTLHQHRENSSPNYHQISNQASAVVGNPPTNVAGPTNITSNDGLILGIDDPNNAYLYNQENRPLMFSTANSPAGNTIGHRMMITNITSLTQPAGGLNPGGLPGNLTRVSISHDPATPLTRPLSMLHLGHNINYGFAPVATLGWRPWMDQGMLVTSDNLVSNHAYFGLNGLPIGVNRRDAVITFGGNDMSQVVPFGLGPNRFRIIFTSAVPGSPGAGQGVGVTQLNEGLEFERYVPNTLNGNAIADPRIGIGDFNSLVPGGADPRNTVEINTVLGGNGGGGFGALVNLPFVPGNYIGSTGASGLQFRDLTSASAVIPVTSYPAAAISNTKVLTVDGQGNVVLITPASTVSANNGLSVINNTLVQLGATCGSPTVGLAALLNSREIPMSNFNFVFTNASGSFAQQNNVGIGTGCFPNNRLEVDRNTGIAPTSGLRLTQLGGAVPLPTNNQVLSVNASGDVILTTVPPGATGIGNYCSQPQNPLTGEFEVPLNLFKYRFTGQGVIAPGGPQQDQVSIGYPCGSQLPVAKFCVKDSQLIANVPFDNYSAHFRNRNSAPAVNQSIITGGVYGEAMRPVAGFGGQSIPLNIGGVFQGGGAFGNIGVLGRTSGISTPTLSAAVGPFMIGGAFRSDSATVNYVNYGVHAIAKNSPVSNFGVYAEVDAGGIPSFNYAIYGLAFPGGAGSAWAGYFDGNVLRTGTDNFTSDQILKQNINPLTNGLSTINQLQPKTFNYNNVTYPQMNLPTGIQYGLIAQDVQTVLPALVNSAVHPAKELNGQSYPAQSYLTLEYTQLIPVLIKAVQELSKQNQTQDSLIQVLTQNINACCENQNARQTGVNGNGVNAQQQIVNQYNVDLSDKDVIVLNQNVPNPYAENTVITYNVPAQYKFAQIIFKTIDGKIIKAVDIEKKGRGQLNVFASDLSNGLYMYTLIVDGKEIDTKKMVKQ